MIIFATNHDDSTAESMSIAKSIIDENDLILLENNAVRIQFLATLKSNAANLMIFSHGTAQNCLGNDENVAFSIDDIVLLNNRKSFVYACWTATELGKMAALQPNCLYAGYNNTVITGGSEIPSEMQRIFRFIKINFQNIDNQQNAENFLNNLSKLCTEAEQNYLKLYPKNLDYIGISTTLRNIWAKLEILLDKRKYIHTDAIEPLLW